MARSRATSDRSKASRRRGRDRVILYSLLIVIAGLLAVMVGLLPDGPPGHDAPVVPDGAAGETGPEPAAEAGSQTLPADSGTIAVGAATETYPAGEAAPARTSTSTIDRELWWLPDHGVRPAVSGTLYLILDDAGNSIDPLPEFLKFPGPMAVAVLPQLAYSVEAAARTAAAGKEIMLHLPMEADGPADPGPGALAVGMSDAQIIRTIDENLGSVPGAIGVNNHMGSRATSDVRLMETVLADLRRRDLFFVDSRTSVDTVARRVAAAMETPFVERHVFLDNERSRNGILEAVRGALELAHQQHSVVMIGHATVEELASVLNEIYPILLANGYEFGAISELVRRGGSESPAGGETRIQPTAASGRAE